MSEKSQTTRTSKNSSEKSCSQQEYFARVVKDRRTGKNGVKFLMGLCDLPLDNDQEDVWGPELFETRRAEEQGTGAGAQWSCTVCTVSIWCRDVFVTLFMLCACSFYFKCLTCVWIHVHMMYLKLYTIQFSSDEN